MSETSPHDAAIIVIRESVSLLDAEIAGHADKLRIATAQREMLLDLIATLSRKPRVRASRPAPRPVPEPANDTEASEPARPTMPLGVFATRSSEAAAA